MSNKYLEKVAALSTVGKGLVRDLLPKLTSKPIGELSRLNSMSKATAGIKNHEGIHSMRALTDYKDKLRQIGQKKGLIGAETNRAVRLATGIARRAAKYQVSK